MPSSISRNASPKAIPIAAEPRSEAQTAIAKPYNPETDPVIIAARERLKNDFITKLCGQGSTQRSGSYGPEVSIERRRY